MARHGVDYKTVKHAALKLLSKGISPSVQKVRDLLKTGSNTTIAEHLKAWREEQAAKEVHHLPATLPAELIATFETLWQMAVEQAEQRLSAVKQDLEDRENKFQQEQQINTRIVDDLTSQLHSVTQKNEDQQRQIQTLHTQLAVAEERLSEQVKAVAMLKKQHETRLKNSLDEKHQLLEKADKLKLELTQCQKQLSLQAEQNQVMLSTERKAQEQSEIRWVKLIDQAKLEVGQLRKDYNEKSQKQAGKIEFLQKTYLEQQRKLSSQQTALKHKDGLILKLENRLESLQAEHTMAIASAFHFQKKIDCLMGNTANKAKAQT